MNARAVPELLRYGSPGPIAIRKLRSELEALPGLERKHDVRKTVAVHISNVGVVEMDAGSVRRLICARHPCSVAFRELGTDLQTGRVLVLENQIVQAIAVDVTNVGWIPVNAGTVSQNLLC